MEKFFKKMKLFVLNSDVLLFVYLFCYFVVLQDRVYDVLECFFVYKELICDCKLNMKDCNVIFEYFVGELNQFFKMLNS